VTLTGLLACSCFAASTQIKVQVQPPAAPADAEGSAVAFALSDIVPNPAHRLFRVSFSLPSAEPARLSVFDISGREVASREVGALGPGLHNLALGDREGLRPGFYLVRLSQAGKSLIRSVHIVQ